MLDDAALVYTLSPCHHSVKLFFKHPSSTYDNRAPSLHLCFHNPPHAYTLQSIAGEGTACGITNISFDELPVGFMEASSGDANMAHMVYCLQTSSMADKEHWFKGFTCHQLKSSKNWPDWDNAFNAQPDAHCKADCIRAPVPQPMQVTDVPQMCCTFIG